jgi:hypothetical protein
MFYCYDDNDIMAWDIPNTRLVITLKKGRAFIGDGVAINAGVLFKSKTNSVELDTIYSNVIGDDEYQAIENLIAKSVELSETWWKILQSINKDAEIEDINDWWNLPTSQDDFDKESFKAIAKINHYYNNEEIKTVFYRNKEKCKYCACLIVEKKGIRTELFKAEPNGDKNIALKNLINSITNVAGYLDKIQNGAWEALIDKDNPNSNVVRNIINGNLILERK